MDLNPASTEVWSGSVQSVMASRQRTAASAYSARPMKQARKALFLRTYSRHVTLFETGKKGVTADMRSMLAQAGIQLAGRLIHATYIDSGLSVTVEGGGRFDLDILYPALGCEVRSELATKLGADCTKLGNLKVNAHQQTTVEGLYAAGDVVSDLHQLAVATGHAAIAATAIHNRLSRNPR
jgi:thioredoxin reductase (NADPH)